jgi:hypothetical protein
VILQSTEEMAGLYTLYIDHPITRTFFLTNLVALREKIQVYGWFEPL